MRYPIAARFLLIGLWMRCHILDEGSLNEDKFLKAVQKWWQEVTSADLQALFPQGIVQRLVPMSLDAKPTNADTLTPFLLGVLDQGECSLADIYKCSAHYWPRITVGMVKDHLEVMAATELLSVDRSTLLDDLIYKIHPEFQDV